MKPRDFEAVIDTVERAEREVGRGRGSDKRRLAVRLINELVNIPLLPEIAEEWLFGLLVDLVVHIYNRWWGHDWPRASGARPPNHHPRPEA